MESRLAGISARDWETLSPLLDRALDLTESQCRDWLALVRRQHPDLVETLQSLLEEHRLAAGAGFLDDALVRPLSEFRNRVVGAYTLVRPLGEGGMGTVWLARRSDGRYQGSAAVKLLTPTYLYSTARERFEREGSVLAQLEHSNIARLLDAGITDDGRPYLVIEYVDGEPIDRYCDGADLDVEARVRLLIDVAEAVSEAHRKLIVHRDIKPSNVFVRRDGVVKLLDFGIAKLLLPAEQPLTVDRGGLLTPSYAAPEQLAGEPITTATDVYALGVLAFELLTGRRPFDSAVAGPAAVAARAVVPRPSSLAAGSRSAWNKVLEGDLDNIIGKALRPEPKDRYGTVSALAEDLRRYLADEPVSARADSLSYRARKFVRRHRAGVAAGSVSVLALVLAGLVSVDRSLEAVRQRDEAQLQLRRAQAANDFVTSLLSQAGPGGRGLTPVELLDRGVETIVTRHADDAGFSVDMLIMLSGRYMDLGHLQGEYRALREAESIARGAGDPHRLLDVHCNTVETEVFADHRAAAAARLQEIRDLLARLGDVDPAVLANCLRQEAVMSREQGRLAEGLRYLEQAKALLEREGLVHGNLYSSLFSWLASFNRAAGRLLDAHRYDEMDLELTERSGRQNTVAGITARLRLASSHLTLGEPDRAAPILEALVNQGAAELHPLVLVRYADSIGELGRARRALTISETALAAMRSAGQQAYLPDAETAAARWLLRTGRLHAAQEILNPLIERLTSAGDAERLVSALLCRAEVGLAAGTLEAARADTGRALQLMDYPHRPHGVELGAGLLLHSRVLAGLGEVESALNTAHAAEAMIIANVPDASRSTMAAAARRTLAGAQALAGDRAAAEHNLTLAAAAYASVLGPQHASSMETSNQLADLARRNAQ